jgi:hypothetical protein
VIKIVPEVVDWQTLSEFPKYEMNLLGEVRDIDTQIRVKPMTIGSADYVELYREGKPFLMHVLRLVWRTFPTGANPPVPSDIERHGEWNQTKERYADGEVAHMCGMVCAVGEV